MPIELKMPALSPTMEEGTLAKWLVKEGDTVKSGDLLAEIETDKATMEFEAVDEGTIAKIVVAEGTDGVKVGAVIAIIAGEDEDAAETDAKALSPPGRSGSVLPPAQPQQPGGLLTQNGLGEGKSGDAEDDAPVEAPAPKEEPPRAASSEPSSPSPQPSPRGGEGAGDRIKASPLARRLADQQGIDLAGVTGSGPNGRVVKADLDGARAAPAKAPATDAAPAKTAETAPAPAPAPVETSIPHEAVKLSNMRKVIARRLTESKQTVPHIYLTVDIRLDALLKLRGELNAGLASRGVKLSVNDLLIKALGVALEATPKCNVSFAGDQLLMFKRADISVAVSIPGGLITPIVTDAGGKSLSRIANEMKDLAARAKDGKLKPEEYQGGTASLSNMGMFGIKQFDAVINPPQGMILAIGAGEARPYVIDGALAVATVMSATGSFDHRAIDGADGAACMKVFKELVEAPLGMLA